MTTLREHLRARDNEYWALEEEYRCRTGGELVVDPYGSYERGPERITRSATVLIGSHNSCASLEKTLRSIEWSSFHQAYPDQIEVVVVDDASTDGTREMIAGLETELRIKYVAQEHGGLTRAHNTGVAVAEGDIIIFSDADMVHMPYALEELMKRHEVLDHVTLAGFRFDVDLDDPRISTAAIGQGLPAVRPEFYRDFRLSFPGRPENICRETRHWNELGGHKRIIMANGAGYDLCAMVVGAFFSIRREQYLRMGGSEERLNGWGCEDSLIAARSIAMGNYVIPVYSAVSVHIAHPRRSSNESAQFLANIRTANAILDEEFREGDGAPDYRHRITDYFETEPAGAAGRARPPIPRVKLASGEDYAWQGKYHEALGQFEQALDCYEEALRRGPESVWWLLGKGKVEHALRRYGDALDSLARCLAMDSSNAWVHFELGLTYAGSGSFEQGREAVQVARRLSPDIFDPRWVLETPSVDHKRRGNHHAGQGDHGLAVTDFELALIVDPENCWAHFDRGASLRALGRLPEALASYRCTDELLHAADGNRTWVHGELGKTYYDLGDDNRAKVELEEALRRYDGNEQAREYLTLLHRRVEDANPAYAVGAPADIPGWLTDGEADLLAAAAVRAARMGDTAGCETAIVEVGSYCGKSTVSIARALKAAGCVEITVSAIDPHEGYAFGGNLATYPILLENLGRYRVSEYVEVICARSTDVAWSRPIALLFIDGLHDYENVKADYEHLAPMVVAEGVIGFHDYFQYCPGVQRFVDELLLTDTVDFIAQRDSLLLVRKRACQQ